MTTPKGRAVTREQKYEMIDTIFMAWVHGAPNQRLGQLIVNAVNELGPLIYIEDNDLVEAILDFVSKHGAEDDQT